MQKVLVLFLVLCSFLCFLSVSLAQENVSESEQESTKKMPSQLALYRTVFKQKRLQQMMAVENIIKLDDYSKQYQIINLIFEKLFQTVEEAKGEITISGYIPGEEFPNEQKHKEAIGHIVENTALLGDVVLRLPDIAHKVFTKNKKWQLLTLWCLSFTNSTTIYDDNDSKLLSLMAQELRLVPREPNYFNPFTEDAKLKRDKSSDNDGPSHSKNENKSRKKKKKKPKGPRLSHAGEL